MYIKRKSQKQEARTAKEFKGKTTPASGALSGAKGDVRTGTRNGSSFNEDDFLIENKFTDKDYYKLELKIWEKIEQEALRDNFRTPLMQIDIQDLQLIVIADNDLTAKYEDIEVKPYFEVTTKSIKLNKEELKEILGTYNAVLVSFDKGKTKKYLAVMLKDLFLSL